MNNEFEKDEMTTNYNEENINLNNDIGISEVPNINEETNTIDNQTEETNNINEDLNQEIGSIENINEDMNYNDMNEQMTNNTNYETISAPISNMDEGTTSNINAQEINQNMNETQTNNDGPSLDSNGDIEFSYFDGSMLELFGYHFLSGFITAFTLGVFRPWAECIVKKYKYSHTVYSGKRLKFDGDPEDLFVQRFKWIFLTIITLGIYSFWVPVRKKQWEISKVHFEDEPLVEGKSYFTGGVLGLIGTNLLCALLIVISVGLLTPLAYCKRLKWFLNNSVVSGSFVQFEGKALKLFLKQLVWNLLTIITFGIYGLWYEIKLTRWQVSNTYLIKDNNL